MAKVRLTQEGFLDEPMTIIQSNSEYIRDVLFKLLNNNTSSTENLQKCIECIDIINAISLSLKDNDEMGLIPAVISNEFNNNDINKPKKITSKERLDNVKAQYGQTDIKGDATNKNLRGVLKKNLFKRT